MQNVFYIYPLLKVPHRAAFQKLFSESHTIMSLQYQKFIYTNEMCAKLMNLKSIFFFKYYVPMDKSRRTVLSPFPLVSTFVNQITYMKV